MIARVSMLLKSRASLTCFRGCFLPGRPKDLSARRYLHSPCLVTLPPALNFILGFGLFRSLVATGTELEVSKVGRGRERP